MMCDILHRISKMWLLFVCCYLFGFGYFLVGFHVILVESVGKEVVGRSHVFSFFYSQLRELKANFKSTSLSH